MKRLVKDLKNPIAEFFWNRVNHIAIRRHFESLEIQGHENIPATGAFLLVSNHVSRWDGLLVRKLIGRPSNFMVSPNELLGVQGFVLRSVGAFPANPRYDLLGFVEAQVAKGEGLVIFPEGDTFRDGTTHPFKNGAARIALVCAEKNIELPVIPMALHYPQDTEVARLIVGEAVEIAPYLEDFGREKNEAIRCLSIALRRQVCALHDELGITREHQALYPSKRTRFWGLKPPHLAKIVNANTVQDRRSVRRPDMSDNIGLALRR